MTNKYTSHITFSLIDTEIVTKIRNDMKPKSSCGFDGLSMKLLKMMKEVFIEPLLIIIKQTLSTGIFPDKLKIAKVIPVYKKMANHNSQIISLFHFCLSYKNI